MTDGKTNLLDTQLCRDAKIEIPIICGAMSPCSSWELVAAASKAGGIGDIVTEDAMCHVARNLSPNGQPK